MAPSPEKNELYPEEFSLLMELLRGLPGVGRRSAERMALQLYHWDPSRRKALAELLDTLEQKIGNCPVCGAMSPGPGQPCSVCSSPKRDHSMICVVEDFSQMRTIENGGVFHGLYHILGGKLAPLEGKTVESLSISPLLERISKEPVTEVIFALSQDVEGRATEVYLSGILKEKGIRISRLAQGLPAGADISFADPATIAAAINGRRNVD